MKILIYGINYAPELTGIGKYSAELAEWLAARGHCVSVVTAPPYYPQWRVHDGYRAGRYAREERAGVSVRRAPLWVPARPGGVKRLLHLASFALSSLPSLLRAAAGRPDVILVVEPALFCAPAAWLAARLCGARAWLHVQDYEVDAAFELGLLKGAWLRRAVARAERWLMRRFDRVSTISERMLALARDKGVEPARAVLLPNWIDAQAITPDLDGGAYRAQLGIPADAIVALYSGNMGGKQGLQVLADVARRLEGETRLWFVFCGQGPERAALQARCAGLARARFLDLQPAERLGELLCMADIHLLPQRARSTSSCRPS
ncbi:WcaI family glycosyltransferase [Achromobacter xylosoxidans]